MRDDIDGFSGLPPDDLETYADHISAGIILLRGPNHPILCNLAVRRHLGLSDEEGSLVLVSRLLRHLKNGSGSSWSEAKEVLRRALSTRSVTSHELSVGGHRLHIVFNPVASGHWALTITDVTERREAELQASRLARVDALTGLANRLCIKERIEDALTQHRRSGEGCALLLLDLDRFKPINDTLGHPIGDALLTAVADRLRAIVQPTDVVSRLGGDEFVVLQTSVRIGAETEALARRIVEMIGRSYIVGGHLVSIGTSMGVAFCPSDGTDTDILLKNADLALYRAKLDGRGTFRFFEPAMDARMRSRRRLELDLRQALARREFELHYQPQMNLESNELVGCEALIRWHHPQRGQVSPADFIPLAEEIGLIVQIGDWVIRQACRDAANSPEHVAVAVNLSPAQFKNPRLVETIMSALSACGLDPRRLELEITETVLLQESEVTLAALHRLRDAGIRISMDDFGTGYSSLSYLRSFPFDKLKIDRSFISDLATKPGADAVIQAIAGLGRSLGMTTVAEGVETTDQMKRIRAEGCTDVQGYLISRPVPAAQISEILSARRVAA